MSRFFILMLLFLPMLALSQEPSSSTDSNSTRKPLIFALQPSYAKRYLENDLSDNIVVKLAKAMNVELELYVCPWARCVKAIETGHADIIDDLFYSSDRAKFTHYLKPSFDIQTAGFRFFADNQHIQPITTWRDLIGKRVGLLRGYKHFPEFDNSEEIQKVEFLDVKTMVLMLLKQRLDAFIVAPSFDESSITPVDPEGKISLQPYARIEDIPLFLGLSRRSAWYADKQRLEQELAELVDNKHQTPSE